MTITKLRVVVLVLTALMAAALTATALLSSGPGIQTAAKAGGATAEVAVVADAKAKE